MTDPNQPTEPVDLPDSTKETKEPSMTSHSLYERLGQARVLFWICPVPGHSNPPDGPGRPVVTVEWRDDVAYCTAPGCDENSAKPPGGTPAYTEEDVDQLTAAVRARIGWPISAGEAATIVTVVLQELAAGGRFAASPGLTWGEAEVIAALKAGNGSQTLQMGAAAWIERLRVRLESVKAERNRFSDVLQATAEALHIPAGESLDAMPAAARATWEEAAKLLQLADAARVWRAQFAKPTPLPRMAALIAAVDALDEGSEPAS